MNLKQKALALFILGILPPGLPLIYLILDSVGLCSGSIFNGGITCSVPMSDYLENVAGQFEGSWFVLLPGLIWLIASVTIWIYAILFLSRVVFGEGAKGQLGIESVTFFSRKDKKSQSFIYKIMQGLLLMFVIFITVIGIVVVADFFELV